MPRVRYSEDLVIRNFGPLPLLMPFLHRIGLAELVDELIPCTRRAHITHGQVVCALVLNRLISPRAIYTLSEWADHAAILDALRIPRDELNDDRILRTLDALVPQLEGLQGSLTWQVMERFDLDTSFIHWDLTSFFFEGQYPRDDQDPLLPQINYGAPKKQDAGKHRKQMQVGVATTEDGGVPLWYRAFSGNAAEVSQVADVMETLKRLLKKSHFTLIGDSKLISEKNMLKACRLGLSFLGPEARSNKIAEEYLGLRPPQRLTLLRYGRNKPRRKGRRSLYMGFETPLALTDPKTGQLHPLRRIFILSSEERRATRKSRRRKLDRLYNEIAKIRRNLGRYRLQSPEDVRHRVRGLLEKTGLSDLFHWTVEGEGRQMILHFTANRAAFRRLRRLDGMYTLVTNLPEVATIDDLLERYKKQFLSEGRFRDLKGPLQLRPLFLKKNRRIIALVFIIYVALLIYCLIERAARSHLQRTATTVPDVYTRRPLKQPTARRLLMAFEFYNVEVRGTGLHCEYFAPCPNDVQRRILDVLDIDQPLDFLQ